MSPVDASPRPSVRPGVLAYAGLPRLLAGPAGRYDYDHHLRLHGSLPLGRDQDALIDVVARAGLTGRGGAAFPAARKLAAVRSGARGDAVVVANAAEGEPASRKDVTLLWHAPHLVLDGLQVAASMCRAARAVLYVHSGQPELLRRLQQVLEIRQQSGVDWIGVQLVASPPRFLAGEESALVAHLNGRAAMPAFKQYRVFERGVDRRPTLVQNVETLAHLALIVRHGARWFRAVGLPAEPGSMLCTVLDAGGQTAVAETALGTPLGRLIRLDDRVQAVLVGGYHGGWLTVAAARELTLSNRDLRPAATFAGAGVLAALPVASCGLAETARVARYLALESAGQCGPCLNGLPSIAAALAVLAMPRAAPAELANLQRWTAAVTGRGACHHPDGTVRLVLSALRVFGAEIAEHSRGRCTASRAAPFLPIPAAAGAETDWR